MPFHQTEHGCFITQLQDGEYLHIFRKASYTQKKNGELYNIELENTNITFEKYPNSNTIKLKTLLGDLDSWKSYLEVFGENHQMLDPSQFITSIRNLVSLVLRFNQTHQRFIVSPDPDRSCHMAIDPKCGFDCYFLSLPDFQQSVECFRPFSLIEIDTDYFEAWRLALVAFFHELGTFLKSKNIPGLTSATLKNKSSRCSLVYDHFKERTHLKQLKCLTKKKKNEPKKCEGEKCYLYYQEIARTNVADDEEILVANQNHTCYMSNLPTYIGFSYLYRSSKMHSMLCAPRYLLNWDWFREVMEFFLRLEDTSDVYSITI